MHRGGQGGLLGWTGVSTVKCSSTTPFHALPWPAGPGLVVLGVEHVSKQVFDHGRSAAERWRDLVLVRRQAGWKVTTHQYCFYMSVVNIIK